MNTAQRKRLMGEWWPQACKAQKWDRNDRALRLRVFGEAVGRELASGSDLDARGDIDKVKAHLLMLADNVKGAMETSQPEMGAARRYRVRIDELMRCVALYKEDPDRYLAELIKDLFHRGVRTECPTLEDLTAAPRFWSGKERPSQLEVLLFTLSSRVNGKDGMRKAAGDSLHDMLTRAGLECTCAGICAKRGVTLTGANPWEDQAAGGGAREVVLDKENAPW